ncbi:hypothetical protein L2E82_22071 [Cichorium intybus]|uniref:Uncharacterized protein n=1 Tax=Cichorium intybus TaxID=13427 RepID=A0ACB9DXI9_CICIN|nr:hypothetical protein L2E82_22071 [Cichorium intybus]
MYRISFNNLYVTTIFGYRVFVRVCSTDHFHIYPTNAVATTAVKAIWGYLGAIIVEIRSLDGSSTWKVLQPGLRM